jgi:hypothetical protein
MITTAITGAIGAILAFFGIAPGPYLGAVWIAVKLLIVGLALLFGTRALAQKKAAPALAAVHAQPEPGQGPDPGDAR